MGNDKRANAELDLRKNDSIWMIVVIIWLECEGQVHLTQSSLNFTHSSSHVSDSSREGVGP